MYITGVRIKHTDLVKEQFNFRKTRGRKKNNWERQHKPLTSKVSGIEWFTLWCYCLCTYHTGLVDSVFDFLLLINGLLKSSCGKYDAIYWLAQIHTDVAHMGFISKRRLMCLYCSLISWFALEMTHFLLNRKHAAVLPQALLLYLQ